LESIKFSTCSKEAIRSVLLQSGINCSIEGFEDFLGPNLTALDECKDRNAAAATFETIEKVKKDFMGKTWRQGCPIPCSQISYVTSFSFFHENSKLDPAGKKVLAEIDFSFGIYLFYETLMTEEHLETLIYDVGAFLAAGGGNLGLMLGFSCLSVLWEIVSFVQNYFLKK
jgi:hypothetical protein